MLSVDIIIMLILTDVRTGCLLYTDVVDYLMKIVIGFNFGKFELEMILEYYYMHAYCYYIEY